MHINSTPIMFHQTYANIVPIIIFLELPFTLLWILYKLNPEYYTS